VSTPSSPKAFVFADTQALAQYGEVGPQPQFLFDSQRLKVVLAGLAPGQRIPEHAESLAMYHFLAGAGSMTVDDDQFSVCAGSTVIVLDGAARGLQADTQLTFLAAKAG
jgi:quercetin dioxygenase-like cupin family protein